MMLAVFCLFALVAGPILANNTTDIAIISNRYAQLLQTVATHQSRLDSLEGRMRKNVAFSARTNNGFGHWLNIAQNAAIHFTYVLTNIGNGYNTLNGHFRASYSGIYMFFFTMRSRWNHPWVDVGIFRNHDLLALASGDGHYGPPGIKSVAMATTRLNVGDAVYCKRTASPGTDIEDSLFTTFSGFLISPD